MGATNRVTPTGEIVASDLRCQMMGNRGCLHRGREVVRPWRLLAWITCVTEFKGRWTPQWAPGRYTVLFFHDEAVAYAAGHRPCAECRRPAYVAFRDRCTEVRAASAPMRAPEMDAVLHAERRDGQRQRTHRRSWRGLPVGAFVDLDGPAVVLGDRVVPWSAAAGYGVPASRPNRGEAVVLTPATSVDVLLAGQPIALHPSLGAS